MYTNTKSARDLKLTNISCKRPTNARNGGHVIEPPAMIRGLPSFLYDKTVLGTPLRSKISQSGAYIPTFKCPALLRLNLI